MNQLLKPLLKALIIPFYRSHAGLLVFVFFMMFGMVEAGQLVSYHRALIEGMHSSFLFLVCVFLIWAFYSFKILLFILNLLRQPAYQFVCEVGNLSRAKVFLLFLYLNAIAFLPVLLYSIFIYQIGITQHFYTSCLYVFLFQLTLCSFNAWSMMKYVTTQHQFSWTLPRLRLPNTGGKIGFYVAYFLNEEKIALLISKVFSIGLLYFVKENTSRGDDFRITALAWLFALSSHTFLILKIRTFEDRYLLWTKALPIPVWKTYLVFFFFYTLLLWPEFLLVTTDIGETITLFDYVSLIFFTGGFMMFIHTHLLKPDRNADQFSIFLFWLFIGSFFIVLCKLFVLLAIGLCVFSYWMTSKRYFDYEPMLEQ